MNSIPPIRVAFVMPDNLWTGGRNYFRNLLAAIQTLPGAPITPVLFMGRATDAGKPDSAQGEVVRTSLLDRKTLPWLLRKVIAKLTGQDILMTRLLQRHHIAVLSHHIHLGRQKQVATIGWIADFQHLHLPELCSAEELQKRERDYRSLCECDRIIVSSECALADLAAFSPRNASRGALLQFVASPAALTTATSLQKLQQTYHFQGPYFLLPNQFWAHKNHRVVIDALRILIERNQPLLVLATGTTKDTRNPDFFPSLMHHVEELGVLDSFRALGQIPFDDLVGLMQNATAFINPSRFEGWSTSVEEAKSMGKQIVLSNIPVHLEQAPPRSFYFSPDDPHALADALKAAHDAFDPHQDEAEQDAARNRFSERQRQFGEAYRQIVLDAINR